MKTVDWHRDPATLRGTRVRVEEAPSWIERHKVKSAPPSKDHPISLLLIDRQIHVGQMSRYTRFVRKLETPQAVQEAGRIEMDFDPNTQVLLIHGISIFRDGKLTNHANLDEIEIIQRERDLERGIFMGGITALIFLKDVRTGDVVDIESSIVSDDAIFPGDYWFEEVFEHTIPVEAQYFSCIADDWSRIQVKKTIDSVVEEESEVDGLVRRTWRRMTVPATELEPSLPLGYNPFGTVSFTTFESWGEVAAAVAELWKDSHDAGPELEEEIAKIQAQEEAGSVALIERLAAFVRDSIRYQGVEIGRLGLIPEAMTKVWERRYGDCKEKTNILCWALRKCGFDAHPALVSVAMGGRVSEHLPAPIFDHVVVNFRFEGADYWLDPTNISQRGSLKSWTSLPFEKALLISKETEGFVDIPDKEDVGLVKVEEHYRFGNKNTAEITVTHDYFGSSADQIRHALESQGRVAVQGLFTEIVGSTRSNLELTSDLEVSDDLASNHVTLRADFSVSDVFSNGGRGQPAGMEFIPHSIAGKVVGVSDKARVHPLGLIHPVNVEHRTKIDHPDAKGSIVRRTIVKNEFMEFDAGTDQDARTPTLFYKFRTKAAEVPADSLRRYRANIRQISEVISLVFTPSNIGASGGRSGGSGASWEEEELRGGPAPVYQRHRGSGSSNSRSIWIILVIGFVVIKVIVAILSNLG